MVAKGAQGIAPLDGSEIKLRPPGQATNISQRVSVEKISTDESQQGKQLVSNVVERIWPR